VAADVPGSPGKQNIHAPFLKRNPLTILGAGSNIIKQAGAKA